MLADYISFYRSILAGDLDCTMRLVSEGGSILRHLGEIEDLQKKVRNLTEVEMDAEDGFLPDYED